MASSRIATDLHVEGHLSSTTIGIPNGTVTDVMVNGSAAVQATKLVHKVCAHYAQVGGTDVTAATMPIHTAYGAGTLVAFEVFPITAPTGGDKAFTVDLKKSTSAGAFATVLSAVVTHNSTSTDRTTKTGTVSSAAYSDGDTFEIVVAVSGSTGNQGQGFVATATFYENAQ